MRKEYRKAALERFTDGVRALLPDFHPWRPPLPPIARGSGMSFFRREVGRGACVFVAFSPSPRQDDAFTVELGWSAGGRVPALSAWPSAFPSPSREELALPEGVVRLPSLEGAPDFFATGAIERSLASGATAYLALLVRQTEPLSAEAADRDMAPLVEGALSMLARIGRAYLDAAAARLAGAD